MTDCEGFVRREGERIVGPVPEFIVEGGGDFEKHVEVVMPHYPGCGKSDIFFGSGESFTVSFIFLFIMSGMI